jgi:hypothetical protein
MCSHFLFILWCPGVHVVQCCLITCVHVFCSCRDVQGLHEPQDLTTWTKTVNTCNKTTLNNMNPRTSQHEQKTWTRVIRQHWTTWTPGHHNMNKKRDVVMSWGSCCSMLSYYMCSRFLFMLCCPGVHVVQCCLITCVPWTKNVNTCNKTTLNNTNPTNNRGWTRVLRKGEQFLYH